MKQIILYLLPALLLLAGCGNSSQQNNKNKAPQTIATPLPLVYSNGDVLDYLDLARLEQVEGIKSAGLSVSVDGVMGIGYWYVKPLILGKDRYIAGKQKLIPTVKQLQALYLEKEEFNETIDILRANGLQGKVALWTGNPYWTSERPPVKDVFYCVLMSSGNLFESAPEFHCAFRAVAELP